MSRKALRIGTCSWNFDSWVGLVYSQKRRTAADYLAEYAEHFRTAEIDSWFYAIPSRASVLEYKSAVPDDFRFTCKVPQEITLTHLRKKSGSEPLQPNPGFLSVERFESFLEAIEPLLPQMDAVMLEFEYLNKQKMSGVSEFNGLIRDFLAQAPDGIPYAIETRNKQYLTASYFENLVARGAGHVFSEKIYMPHVWEVYDQHRDALKEMELGVIRLLGGDRKEIEALTGKRWDRVVVPKEQEKERVVGMVTGLLSHAYTILNVNNHYEGAATTTIQSIRGLLAEKGIAES